MAVKYIGFGCAAAVLLVASMAQAASPQQPTASDSSQAMVAQNTYSGGTVFSQDSIFQNNTAMYPVSTAASLRREVEAAETNINLSAAFMHTQYHENAEPGTGDDESGYTFGLSAGLSGLVPVGALGPNADVYTSLAYEFSAGDITYNGHYLFTGQPVKATDRAVFNRIEARLGIGFPLAHGIEVIPFIAAGYQAWNRNDSNEGEIASDEFYDSGLIGGGIKLDLPLTTTLVASVSGEVLALVGANVDNDSFGLNHSMGVSAEERIALGLDYQVEGPFHAIGSFYWQHFNYAGFKPNADTAYLYEPLSTTTQFGADLGIAYSF